MSRPDLSLEFANTRYWRGQAVPTETLNGPQDLANWVSANGGPGTTKPLSPREFERAIDVRETIHRLFDTQAQGKTPSSRDLGALNTALADAPMRATLKRDGETYRWEIEARGSTALNLLAPVLWSAGDLLAGPRLGHVRRCANPDCGWLFLDESRAGKRRWCFMQSCGNRAKARRHYQKSKED